MKDLLLEKIKERTAKVCVVGVGYVGLPLLLGIANSGYTALGYDIDWQRVSLLQSGKTGISHIPDSSLATFLASGQLKFTADINEASGFDIFIICVPTPLDDLEQPDLSYIENATNVVTAVAARGALISLESTTYPGTTRDIIVPAAKARRGFEVGRDVFICFSPEREDPGRKTHNLHTTPKVVGGITPACTEVAYQFYKKFVWDVVRVGSAEVAEMAKLIENTHRAVNIALANELKSACDSLNIDFYEAMDAAATKPYGFTPYYPGPGVGGHCIPVDPKYLTWQTDAAGFDCALIKTSLHINDHAHFRCIDALGTQLELRGSSLTKSPKILLVGAAYKAGVEDVRESPFFKVATALINLGVKIEYLDPMVPELKIYGKKMTSVTDLTGYDGAIIVTNQAGVDYEKLAEVMPFVIDARRSYEVCPPNVVRA